jgi:hypothetical protein
MGNLCSSNSSVGVIETRQTENYEIQNEDSINSQNARIVNDYKIEEDDNVDLGTFEFNINQWKTLINSLKNNKTLEKYSLSKKRTDFSNIDQLALFLKASPAINEFEKAWVLFLWITHNIDYDAESFRTGKFPQQDAGSVFKNGKSVCAGYSSFYKYLCESLNLKCILINGYAKGFGYKMGVTFRQTNHEWNAVRLDGKWYLLDSTWGAGNVDLNFKFQKEFKPFYFLVPAQVLIFTHFPLKQKTQTIKPISQKEFENLPRIDLKFFVLGFSCLSLISSTIECSVNPFFIEFESEKHTELMGYLEDEKQTRLSNAVLTQRDSKTYKQGLIVFIPEKAKKYTLELFARREKEEDGTTKNFVNVGEIGISRSSDNINKNMPHYQIAFDYDIKLISHFSSFIVCNKNPLNLEFSAPLTVNGFKVSLRESNNKLVNNCSIYQRSIDQKNIELMLALPKKDEIYKLELFALAKFIGSLWLKRDEGDDNDVMSFFQTFSGLTDYKAHVFSPYEQNLKRNLSYLFKIFVGKCKNAALVFQQKEWIYLKKDEKDEIWSIDQKFDQSGTLQLFIMIDDQWKGICGYNVV